MSEKEVDNFYKRKVEHVISNSIFFTHGGPPSGLFGIISSGCLSSVNYLKLKGDKVHKTTDQINSFTSEDSYIFFESPIDRGKFSYREIGNRDFYSNDWFSIGKFVFLIVADANSLLNQVSAVGLSDGLIMARTDGKPININLSEVSHKIIIPEEYKEEVNKYIEKVKKIGIKPFVETIEFKSKKEIEEIESIGSTANIHYNIQEKMAKKIGIKCSESKKSFGGVEQLFKTKTSQVLMKIDENPLKIVLEDEEGLKINSAEDIVRFMKERPTPANLQAGSNFLFGIKSNHIFLDAIKNEKLSNVPLLDLINNHSSLSFVINEFIQYCSFNLEEAKSKIKNSNASEEEKKAIFEAINVAKFKEINEQDFLEIKIKYLNDHWLVSSKGKIKEYTVKEKDLKEWLEKNNVSNIYLWKKGNQDWITANQLLNQRKNISEDKIGELNVDASKMEIKSLFNERRKIINKNEEVGSENSIKFKFN